MNKFILIILITLTGSRIVRAQAITPVNLTDLNTWSNQSSLISWFGSGTNAPLGQGYGTGIQFALPGDSRFGSQIVIPTFYNEMFFRRNQAGTWDPWNRVWSSNNLNKDDVDFICRNLRTNGNLWAKEIKVAAANPWPDYVFKASHKLTPLDEIKTFILTHQHLPEIPSGEEISKNGIDLGVMNTLLMKKVEELTLYLIEKDEEQKKQSVQLKEQQEFIKKITQRLNEIETRKN